MSMTNKDGIIIIIIIITRKPILTDVVS